MSGWPRRSPPRARGSTGLKTGSCTPRCYRQGRAGRRASLQHRGRWVNAWTYRVRAVGPRPSKASSASWPRVHVFVLRSPLWECCRGSPGTAARRWRPRRRAAGTGAGAGAAAGSWSSRVWAPRPRPQEPWRAACALSVQPPAASRSGWQKPSCTRPARREWRCHTVPHLSAGGLHNAACPPGGRAGRSVQGLRGRRAAGLGP
mmetsp:Transcript_53202/g.158555  ORF Transcript_53202/g.158555 Transcript_53202/m.158555 type:complete len:203 (-) Transcript_53202:8-616(-)